MLDEINEAISGRVDDKSRLRRLATKVALIALAAGALLVLVIVLATTSLAVHKSGHISVMLKVDCGPREAMIAELGDTYSEGIKSVGIGKGNRLMEFYVSEIGTWTLVMTTRTGLTCYYAFGGDFQDVPWDPPDSTSDSGEDA